MKKIIFTLCLMISVNSSFGARICGQYKNKCTYDGYGHDQVSSCSRVCASWLNVYTDSQVNSKINSMQASINKKIGAESKKLSATDRVNYGNVTGYIQGNKKLIGDAVVDCENKIAITKEDLMSALSEVPVDVTKTEAFHLLVREAVKVEVEALRKQHRKEFLKLKADFIRMYKPRN